MKKQILLILLAFTSLTYFAQAPRPNTVQSKVTTPSSTENIVTTNAVNNISKGTIFFNEKGKAESVAATKTSFVCSIFLFENVSEAQTFAVNFKNSDSNISEFSFTGVKNNLYYFNFSLLEPRDTKWYLQLFKKNNLLYVSNNNKTQSIDQALSK